jgi:hypothetical protein
MLEDPSARHGLAATVREHPLLTASLVAAAAAGMVIGVVYLPAEWALARRLAAGAIAGAGSWLLVAFVRFFYD